VNSPTLRQRLAVAAVGVRAGVRWSLLVMGGAFAAILAYDMQPLRILHNVTPSLRDGIGFYVYDSSAVRDVHRGDIVAFSYAAPDWVMHMSWPNREREVFIKHVYGLPGDRIEALATGDVRVCAADGSGCSTFQRLVTDSKGKAMTWAPLPEVIPHDEYFMAGEHYASLDSRYLGPVQRHAFLGKVVHVYATPIAAEELSGANRAHTTQALNDADLQAIAASRAANAEAQP
jgi:signal peptidase I